MNLKLSPLDLKNNFFLEELEDFFKENEIFKKDPIVLEKNENSDLVPVSKPSTQEFFENVFSPSGPFWSVYSKVGFAARPFNTKYAAFICGRLYFLKNIENRFMQGIGFEKSFGLKGETLIEGKKLNISNLLLLLSLPFDLVKQFSKIIELGFMANGAIKKFEDFRRKTIDYHNRCLLKLNILDLLKTADESLKSAVYSMTFSNLALLSYNLKVKLKRSKSIEVCESGYLNELIKEKNLDVIKKSFGFYSLNPYDISKPRFREDISDLQKYGSPGYPQNYFLKWRENAKFLAARYLDIERKSFKKLGKITGLGDLIFYLKVSDILGFKANEKEKLKIMEKTARERKKRFDEYAKIELPPKIIYYLGKVYSERSCVSKEISKKIIKAESVSSEKIAVGSAININSFDDYRKFIKGGIIVSKSLSPNLTILFKKAAGVVSESGGFLSHSAVIAREMGLPCLIRARFNSRIEDGQYLELNGKNGEIKFLDRN